MFPGKHRIFIRDIEAGNYLEIFLVSSVAAILGIRLFLQLTGYPKVGGGTLHIAHMLWGGLLMLVALIVMLSFLSKAADRTAAILGGLGFGTFIDEVGKFVTKDNDYFFQPAVALMYITFILIIITTRAIHKRRGYSKQEYLMNALHEMEEVALHDLDEEEKQRALSFLQKSEPGDPMVVALKELLSRSDLVPTPSPGILTQVKKSIRSMYRKLAGLPGFSLGIVIFFVGQLVIKLMYAIVLIFFKGFGMEQILNIGIFQNMADRIENLTFIEWAEFASSLVSAVFVFLGIFCIHRSRLMAFKLFERSILVSIFLTQVFVFYREQFVALVGLGLNILILMALRYMIHQEETD